mgnify:CR=1 FL=1
MGKFCGRTRGELAEPRVSYIGFEVVVLREVDLVSDGFAETASGDLGRS